MIKCLYLFIHSFYQGIKRICDDLSDIAVDVPNAHALLERLGNKLLDQNVIGEKLYGELPVRYVICVAVVLELEPISTNS